MASTPRIDHLGPVLEAYMAGGTAGSIADKLDLTKQKVEYILSSFRHDYMSCLAVRELVPRYESASDVIHGLNAEFYKLLSNPGSALSNEEMLYCAFYVSTGNSLQAVIDSGLDIGLKDGSVHTKDIYVKNCLLRSESLKRKRNIQEEIRRMQMESVEIADLTKDKILAMHISMIEQLREGGDPKDKSNIVKLLDQVNKMQGNYTTKIVTGEITADDVLDAQIAIMEKGRAGRPDAINTNN